MKKKLSLVFLVSICFGCSQKVDISKTDTINGYWQITKALNTNGDKKDYPINEVYDYYEIKGKTGFHKKATWQPDGVFLVNDLSESVKLSNNSEGVFIQFRSKFGKHTEKIESISEKELVLETPDKAKLYFSKVILNTRK
ncbi:lipocalin family protein [Flavobacterium psychrophilum]